jgi:hypothetical protein
MENKSRFEPGTDSFRSLIVVGGCIMREDPQISRVRAWKSRIRQRLDSYRYGSGPHGCRRTAATEFMNELCSLCSVIWRFFRGLQTTQSRKPADV